MPREVVVVKCAHDDPESWSMVSRAESSADMTPDLLMNFKAVVESQLSVAHYIANNRDCAVIRENTPSLDKITFRDIIGVSFDKAAKDTRSVFPNGLPSAFSQLNFEQKKYLYLQGGVCYLVSTGLIEKTYSDDLTYTNNRNEIASKQPVGSEAKIYQFLVKTYQTREYYSLVNAKKVAEITGKKVIIVAGALHEYKDVATCVEVKLSSFDTVANIPHIQTTLSSLNSYREPVDCKQLASTYRPANSANRSNTRPQTDYMAAGVNGILGIIALGMCCFLMFKCCRRSQKPKRSEQHTKMILANKPSNF